MTQTVHLCSTTEHKFCFYRQTDASLCPWESHLTFIPMGASKAVHPQWWPSLTKNLQIKPKKVLCVGVVRQTHSGWFVRMNDLANRLVLLVHSRPLMAKVAWTIKPPNTRPEMVVPVSVPGIPCLSQLHSNKRPTIRPGNNCH